MQDMQSKPMSASGIIGLVSGGIALLTSFIPIINNASAIFGLVGAVLGVCSLVSTRKGGKKSGRTLAVVALVISVLSVAIVLALQAQWSAMLS